MKNQICLLAMLLACCTVAGQTVNMSRQRYRLSRSDFVDTIPIVVDRWQQVLIPVTIQGRQRYFKLDTGRGFGVLYAGGAIRPQRELGLVLSVDGSGLQTMVRVVKLPPFSIGSLQVSDYAMTEAPSSVLSHSFGHDGILGFAFFNQGLSAKIDFARRRLIVTDRRCFFDRELGHRVNYRVFHFAPYVWTSPVPGLRLNTLFDTGSSELFLLGHADYVSNAPALGQVVTEHTQGRSAIANHGVERHNDVAFLHIDRLLLGNTALTDVESRTYQGTTSLGRQLLQYGSLVIVPHRGQFIFQPYAPTDTIAVGNTQPDIFYVPQGPHASVGLIRSTSPWYQAGLRQADVILRIDGRDVDFRSYTNFHWVLGRRYILDVQDAEGAVRKVEITR